MSSIYLVRHALADFTPDEMRPLSARGRRDALRVADLLADRGIEAIYASPYRRARETVEPLAERLELGIQLVPDLRERTLGGFEGGDFEAAVLATWRDFEFAHPGGESSAAARRRGAAVLSELAARHPDASIAAASHGNLIALALGHFDPRVDFAFWQALSSPDVHRIELDGGRLARERLWPGSGDMPGASEGLP